MASANVELLRRGYEAFARGDVEFLLAAMDPDIEWRAAEDTEVHHGPEGVIKSVGGWLEVWEQYELTLEDLIEVDHETVIAASRSTGRGRESRMTVENRFFQVWTIRDGKLVRMEECLTLEDALREAGQRP